MEIFEHVADKNGIPLALLIWMFWRDYQFLTIVSSKLQVATDLLTRIAERIEGK